MTVNDLRQKYIGKLFQVKSSGISGKCIQVNGYRKADIISIWFCLHLDKGNTWFLSDDIEPIKETLF